MIDKGSIAEKGTHDELLAKDGVYKRLVLRQLTAGAPSLLENVSFDEERSINHATEVKEQLS